MKEKIMKTQLMLCCLLMACLFEVSVEKETFILEESKKTVTTAKAPPKVQAYDCSNCVYDDGVNSICVDHSVQFDLGWDFTQEYGVYSGTVADWTSLYQYTLRFKPYAEVDAVIHPHISIDRLYTNEITANIDTFKTYLFGEMNYFEDHSLCFGLGWASDAVIVQIQMAMAFRDCYKNIIYTLSDFSNWHGPTAKWIDDCDNSNDEDISLFTWTPLDEQTDKYWIDYKKLDTVTQKYVSDCKPGKLLLANNLASQISNKLIFYAIHKFMKK